MDKRYLKKRFLLDIANQVKAYIELSTTFKLHLCVKKRKKVKIFSYRRWKHLSYFLNNMEKLEEIMKEVYLTTEEINNLIVNFSLITHLFIYYKMIFKRRNK